MKCPICSQQLVLVMSPGAYSCPQCDGLLVTARHLVNKDIPLDDDSESAAAKQAVRNGTITCPHCSSVMHKVDYDGSGVIIDSCNKCLYRWLDAGEIDKIQTFKPTLTGDDLLFLLDLQLKQKAEAASQENLNPDIPLSTAARVISIGNGQRTFGTLLGMGLYGLIVGPIKSKFLRYVIPLLLVIVALVYYMVIKSF